MNEDRPSEFEVALETTPGPALVPAASDAEEIAELLEAEFGYQPSKEAIYKIVGIIEARALDNTAQTVSAILQHLPNNTYYVALRRVVTGAHGRSLAEDSRLTGKSRQYLWKLEGKLRQSLNSVYKVH